MKNCMIIVNYNDYKSTKHLIDNVYDFDTIDEIVVVDNNSKNEEKDLLKLEANNKVTILLNDENAGYSSAINTGVRYLCSKYTSFNIIVSNSDIVILSEEDLKKMLGYLNNPNIGLVGPQVLERGLIIKGCKNIKPKMDAVLNLPIMRNIFEEKKLAYPDDYYNDDISYVDVVSTCFFLITSDVMKKINYMDENVFLYYEDFILGKKINKLGLKTVVCNNVKVKHLYSKSVDKIFNEISKIKLLMDSQIYFHTIYNDASKFDKILLRFTINLNVLKKRFLGLFKKEN